jgi:BED zinc finger
MFEETQINEILCNEETQVNEILYNEETSSTLSQESLDLTASSSLIPTPLTSIPLTSILLTSTIKTQSIAWQYFNKVYDEKGKHIQSKCKYCIQIYSKGTSTTILKEHWAKYHSKIQPGSIGSLEASFGFSVSKPKLQKEDIMEKLINWIIMDNQPFQVVDNTYFKELINILNPGFQIPSRNTIKDKIYKKFTEYKQKLINILQVIFLKYFNLFY